MLEFHKNQTEQSIKNSSENLARVKKQAYENFTKLGLPTRKMENWRYINLTKFNQCEFSPELESASRSKSNNNAVTIGSDHLKKLAKHPFANLAIAMAKPKNFEKITVDTEPQNDIQLDFELVNSIASQKIFEIELAKNISANLSLNFSSQDQHSCSSANHVFFIKLNKNAKLNIFNQQNINKNSYLFNAIFIEQDNTSEVNYFSLDVGGKLARTDIEADFNDKHAGCHINGLIIADQDQVIDHHNIIRHNVGHCTSSENIKTVLKDKAKVIFNGKIIMAKDAQKSQTAQSNKNLLLSAKAEINTKPELEIYADDVKAAHGATTGQLDKDALYYLKTRGFSDDSARKLLLDGFIKEIVLKIPNDKIKAQWEKLLSE